MFSLLHLNSVLKCHYAHEKLAIAQFADLAAWFLPICIDAAAWKLTLLVKAILAIRHSTELAVAHLLIVLEHKVATGHTSICLCLLLVRLRQEVDWILLVQIILVVPDLHDLVSTSE